MSSWIDDMETICKLIRDLELEDLSRPEQRAVLRLAHHVDKTLNRQTRTNKRADETYAVPSRLALELGCKVKDCRICNKTPDRSGKGPNGERIEDVWRRQA